MKTAQGAAAGAKGKKKAADKEEKKVAKQAKSASKGTLFGVPFPGASHMRLQRGLSQ